MCPLLLFWSARITNSSYWTLTLEVFLRGLLFIYALICPSSCVSVLVTLPVVIPCACWDLSLLFPVSFWNQFPVSCLLSRFLVFSCVTSSVSNRLCPPVYRVSVLSFVFVSLFVLLLLCSPGFLSTFLSFLPFILLSFHLLPSPAFVSCSINPWQLSRSHMNSCARRMVSKEL